jgi:tetratricopeptide (TPR) repeat protein
VNQRRITALRTAAIGHVDTPSPFKYRAFLSYSHRDIGWAKWLHAWLEGFRFDKDLIGRETPLGTVPKTLRPIFRDREDFSGGHTLTDATVAALDASAALIVLCSPVAASRPAVNEEVRLFRSRHPDRPVIPVIVDGTWPDNFPTALRFELAAHGSVTDRPTTILGPDLRDAADGKTLSLAKAVAGLTGLGADDVFRRAERARRRRTRIWGAVAGFCLLLAVLASGSAIYAWQQLKTNEAFLSATLKTATDIVNTAVAQAQKYNVPRAATLELLTKAEGLFDNMAQYGRPTPELQYQKAWMLIEFARNYAALGDSGKERSRAEEAYRLLAGLAAAKPDDIDYQRSLAAAYNEVGEVQMAQNDLAAALRSYGAGLAITRRLAQTDPGNGGWQRDLAVSYDGVGDAQVAQGDLTAALESYREGFAIRQRLAQANPGNATSQRDLAVSYDKIGDVQEAKGDLAAALKFYRDGLAILQRLAQSDPGNAAWQRDLSVRQGRQRADGAGRPGIGAAILSRWPRDHAALGTIRSRQRQLAARFVDGERQGRRGAGNAGRPCCGAAILSGRPHCQAAPGAIRSRQRPLAARFVGIVREGRRRAGGARRPSGAAIL